MKIVPGNHHVSVLARKVVALSVVREKRSTFTFSTRALTLNVWDPDIIMCLIS